MSAADMTAATAAVVTTSRAVVVMDHIKNNRIEYILLAIAAHLLGWTQQGLEHVQGMCI